MLDWRISDCFLFGTIGIILLIFGYFMFDLVLRKICFTEELKKNNTSVAIVIAAFIIGLSIIISRVVGG